MSKLSLVAFLASMMLLSGSRCQTSDKGQQSAAVPASDDPGPEIRKEFQEEQLKALAQSTHAELIMLLSYSGWADKGQIVLHLTSAGRVVMLDYPQGAKTRKEDKSVDRTMFQEIARKAESLSSYEKTAMDGVDYEFVHYVKDGNTIRLIRRIFMPNPSLRSDGEHLALVKMIQGLRT